MDKAERDLFMAERKRLKRTQTAVGIKSGVGQGLISQIEIDPDYNPTVAVFKKAVTGIDLTLSSFYARIEGLPTVERAGEDSSPPPQTQAVRDDEATLVPSARDYQEIIATLSHLLALARQGRDGLHRRQTADPGPPATRHARHRQKRDPRTVANRPKTRRPKN